MSGPLTTRRGFLEAAGSGLFVFFQEPSRLPSRASGYPSDLNAYLKIGPDGRVTCMVGKVELGQGSKTALAQLLAEELDVALDTVDMVMGDTDLCPWDMGTFGSLSIRMFGPVLRAAGAEARAALFDMAGERLSVPVAKLTAKNGVVSAGAAQVSYAALVAGKRIERHVANAQPKAPAAFSVVGTSPRRKDILEKVTGRAKYAGDFTPAGLLHARLVRPPAHGAVLKSVDTAAAEKVAGVRVVRDGDLIAVLHERPDLAERALDLVKANWERPASGPDDKTIFDHLLKTCRPPSPVAASGSLEEGAKLATVTLDETYLNSYVAHAPIETHSATAVFENGKVTVWAGTQSPFGLKPQVAQALGLPAEKVRIVTPYVGGGFGGKNASQQGVEAARLAKLTGRPVQVVWRRDEEFFYDTFRPAAVVKIRSGLTKEGRIAFWDYAVYGAGDREAKLFYDVPHQKTVSSGGWMGGNPPDLHPFAVGPWRAPSVNTNTFARESHIDMLAMKAGVDPVEFRLNHLTDQRMLRVLDAAAERFGWKPRRTPSGRGVGVSCGIYAGTCVATMAEVAVDRASGRVRAQRVVCAQDEGVIVSPDGSRQQIEGSIMMGLGYALTEEIRFKNGEVLDRNFDTYQLPRFSWMPKIETVLIANPEIPALGCGEPPIVNMGAVIANAIYDAVGARLLQLPMTPARVKAALERA